MNENKQANGGHARAKNLSPARRKAIAAKAAKARWGNPDAKAPKKATREVDQEFEADLSRSLKKAWNREFKPLAASLRDEIACAVLTGLYANIDVAQKFAAHVMGPDMLLPEAFTRIAYAQADESLRLRAL
jgi:hypothetical protein